MNEKTFLEKYPEFEGKIIKYLTYKYKITVDDVEEILDKHFVRRKDITGKVIKNLVEKEIRENNEYNFGLSTLLDTPFRKWENRGGI